MQLKEDIYNYAATCYHRTGKEHGNLSVKGIIYYGFKPGRGALYGKAMYCTYLLEDQMNSSMISSYGQYILKVKMNLHNFIITEPDEAKKVYGEHCELEDQLKILGFDKKFPMKPTVTHLNYDRVTFQHGSIDFDKGLFMVVKGLKSEGKLRDKSKVVKIKGGTYKSELYEGDEGFDFLKLTNKDGKVVFDYPFDLIDSFYTTEVDDTLRDLHEDIAQICEDHKNRNYSMSSDIAKRFYDAFANRGYENRYYDMVQGLVYSGRNDARCCISYHPKKNVIPLRACKAPIASQPLKEIKWFKFPPEYLKRYFGVVVRKEPKDSFIVDPTVDTDEFRSRVGIREGRLDEEFEFDSLSASDQQALYDAFKHSYEKATGNAWDQSKFVNRAYNWTFFGDVSGGIAVRKQKSGLIKLNASYGSPRGVIKGFQELVNNHGDEPIWGAMDKKIATHLESQGFISPPKIVIKLLVPILNKVIGDHIQDVAKDGGLIVNTEFGPCTKYFVANKAYFTWFRDNAPGFLAQSAQSGLKAIPSIVTKWLSLIK